MYKKGRQVFLKEVARFFCSQLLKKWAMRKKVIMFFTENCNINFLQGLSSKFCPRASDLFVVQLPPHSFVKIFSKCALVNAHFFQFIEESWIRFCPAP